MHKRAFGLAAAGVILSGALLLAGAGGRAQEEVTLKVAHSLPTSSTAQQKFLEPWAKSVEEASGGRIKVEIYPAMQLGGKPPQLYDQARGGIADVIHTVTGYTPGRFPSVEVFELPFMATSAAATSQAVQAFYEEHLQDEFADVHPLFFHVHAPGLFHMTDGAAVQALEDLEGKKVRAPTRTINDALGALGATPVGMPATEVPESLSRGVIDGVLFPWEVVTPLRVHEMTESHTAFGGDRGLYTAVFLFAMNKDRYESLPDDLKQVIDDHSGIEWAEKIGGAYAEADEPGRQAAEELGHEFYTIEGEELERWKEATQPVVDAWVEQMNAAGKDGKALLEDARALVEQYSATD